MIRTESVLMSRNGCEVFIKKRIFIKESFKSYSLYVYDYELDWVNNEKVVDFQCLQDLNKSFISVVNSYKNRGYK